jgi:CDP-diacylglycerol--inositol 3-phosphatidyltransferase
MPLHPRRCSFLYSISCLLDALDGWAARKFKQSTRFGAVLDMITDRCTTTCLLVFLATAKPAYSMIFQGLISLDFASHYMHMYATLAMGGQGESHKNVSAERSRIMNLYYTNKVFHHICQSQQRRHLLTVVTGRAVHCMCAQRALLHRPLPPLLQLALHHASASPC